MLFALAALAACRPEARRAEPSASTPGSASASASAFAPAPTPVEAPAVANDGAPKETLLEREANGHFYVHAKVNGELVRFLVDTGAGFHGFPVQLERNPFLWLIILPGKPVQIIRFPRLENGFVALQRDFLG